MSPVTHLVQAKFEAGWDGVVLQDDGVISGELLKSELILINTGVVLSILGDVAEESRFDFGHGGGNAGERKSDKLLHVVIYLFIIIN